MTVTVGHGLRAEVDVELELESEVGGERAREISRRHHRRVALGLASTGGAVLVAGAVFGGLAVSNARGAFVGSADAESARTYGVVADVAFGVGGGLATTAFVLWRVHHGDDHESAPAVVPIVSRDTIGVRGRF